MLTTLKLRLYRTINVRFLISCFKYVVAFLLLNQYKVLLSVFHSDTLRFPWATPQLPRKQRTASCGIFSCCFPTGVYVYPAHRPKFLVLSIYKKIG